MSICYKAANAARIGHLVQQCIANKRLSPFDGHSIHNINPAYHTFHSSVCAAISSYAKRCQTYSTATVVEKQFDDRRVDPGRFRLYKRMRSTEESEDAVYRPASHGQRSNTSSGFSSHHRSFDKNRRTSSNGMYRNKPGYFETDKALLKINWDEANLHPIRKDLLIDHPDVMSRSTEEIDEFLKREKIRIDGSSPFPKPVFGFEEVGFPETVVRLLYGMQFKKPSAIQMMGWPIALSGRDLISVAQTGSGKTFAYLLPAFVHILAQPSLRRGDGPVALVLVPTRELAQQVLQEVEKFSTALRLKCTAVYGGVSHGPQRMALMSGVDLVVATPGRLLDFLMNETISLKRTSYLVLDEGDRMLDMGFEPQIRKICSQIRPDKQCLLWSATFPHEIRKLARSLCHTDPVRLQVGSSELQANPDIQQNLVLVSNQEKEEAFFKWLGESHFSKILVFCQTKKQCDHLNAAIREANRRAIAIHGDKSQKERDRAIAMFHRDASCILVATDVAARGLDISDIGCVVNFGMPQTIEDYIHRIGRTGRAGMPGVAVTFFVSSPISTEAIRMARDVSEVLRSVGQSPPEELLRLASMH